MPLVSAASNFFLWIRWRQGHNWPMQVSESMYRKGCRLPGSDTIRVVGEEVVGKSGKMETLEVQRY